MSHSENEFTLKQAETQFIDIRNFHDCEVLISLFNRFCGLPSQSKV